MSILLGGSVRLLEIAVVMGVDELMKYEIQAVNINGNFLPPIDRR